MKVSGLLVAALCMAAFFPVAQAQQEAVTKTYNVLELPAVKSDLADKSMLLAVRKFGDRLYAVGHQGHIIFSDDNGSSWTQAEVPVRSTLTDIFFPSAKNGWAVGHEGVILHSGDGGKTWEKQYDGLRYGKEGLAFYQKLLEENPDNETYAALVDEMDFAISQGADKPFFRVYFHDDQTGHALGAYGMMLLTTDGGKTWVHRLETAENDSYYHLFDFTPLPEKGRFFVTGEAGVLLIADINEKVSKLSPSVPWEGSFFTAIDTADGATVIGGLRGRMFRTDDAGESWITVEKPATSAIVDTVRLQNNALIAVGIGGEILMSADNGNSFSRLPIRTDSQIYAVAEAAPGELVLAGPDGIKKVSVQQK